MMQSATKDFGKDYTMGGTPPLLELERGVLGSDYRATSWTTREEAVQMSELLELTPSAHLLDIGAGAGWPGLYLAQISKCAATLIDLPFVAMQLARERAAVDAIADRCVAVVGDAARLPFVAGAFDAISHSDVLCCTPAKAEVLRECRRVARKDAKMAFSVITLVQSLSGDARALAIASGPPFVDAAADYSVLIKEAGWRMLRRFDLTPGFARTLGLAVDAMQARAAEIVAAIGGDEFAAKLERRSAAASATQAGLLMRELFLATTH